LPRQSHCVRACAARACTASHKKPRYRAQTRAYVERRQADGLSKREAIRCVKRYIARQTFHTIRADLAAKANP
jgi:hypothetical protein